MEHHKRVAHGSFDGTATVSLVDPPLSGFVRHVLSLLVFNADAITHTPTISFQDGKDQRKLWTATAAMAVNERKVLPVVQQERMVLEKTGQSFVGSLAASASTSNPTWYAVYEDRAVSQ